MRRHPFREKLSRAVLTMLSGPDISDRRVLGRYYTDEELARLDPAARGWVAPVPVDELAARRRRRQRATTTARSEMGRAAP